MTGQGEARSQPVVVLAGQVSGHHEAEHCDADDVDDGDDRRRGGGNFVAWPAFTPL